MVSSVHFGKTRRVLGIAVTALVLAVAAGSIGARPALADDGWHRGYERHGWREHEWREHDWHDRGWHDRGWHDHGRHGGRDHDDD